MAPHAPPPLKEKLCANKWAGVEKEVEAWKAAHPGMAHLCAPLFSIDNNFERIDQPALFFISAADNDFQVYLA
jgi:hypothetical protein